jgi:hypothetical protein
MVHTMNVMRRSPVVFGSLLLGACGFSGPDAPLEASRRAEAAAPSSLAFRSELATAHARVVIHVDDDAGPGGDGSARAPFHSIADAVGRAASVDNALVVVAPGRYEVSSSIRIASPMELRGSNALEVDSDGMPTGSVVAGTETRVVGTAALGPRPLISVGRSDGGVLTGIEIAGFSLECGPETGDGVDLARTQDYALHDNVITGRAAIGIFSVASSGSIAGNYISVDGAGAIVAAGYAGSPSNVQFVGNRSVRNGNGGVLLNGSSFSLPETGDQLDVLVRGNDLSDNAAKPAFSFGLRIFMIRRDLGLPGDTQSSGNVRATIQDNRIVGNEIGVTVDAGFPYRRSGTICDPRVYSGAIELDLRGNTLSGSRSAPAVLTFTRNTTALNQTQLAQWQYVHSTLYDITDVDGTLADAVIDHPERDPYVGSCPNDGSHELLDNMLLYNGTVLSHTRPLSTGS